MTDDTAAERRFLIESGTVRDDALKALESGEPYWTAKTLQRDFRVIGFAAPFVVVERRSDGMLGSLEFTHSPRIYFGFTAHSDTTSNTEGK